MKKILLQIKSSYQSLSIPGGSSGLRRLIPTLLIVVICFLIYSNTLETSFHFDDWLYIIDNRHVHLKELSFSKLAAAATKSPLPRPVSNISFALNYYFGRLNVFGYHLVNLLIHALAGVIIYLLLVTTLNLGSLKGRYKKRERLALIITLLWVMHPIQTQPVNYIMQRMTSLAGMFYLLSLYFYMRGRLGGTRKIRVLFYSGSMAAGLLALGSKENAGVLPLILALYEFYFFQNLDFRVIRRNWVFIIGILVIFISTAFIYLGPNVVEGVLEFYQNKDFTVGERLLTQLRVVMHYISLLFAPLPSRLNLDYDFPVSQSLFNPPSTFFSLLGLIGLVVMGVYLARRNPLVSFGVLWFLGNLVVESSVVGLEMVFEHRLYLPSLGLFLLIEGIDRRKVNERAFIYGAFTVLLLLAFWAIQRNTVWKDEFTLWSDSVKKSPDKARPYNNLGMACIHKGMYDEAIREYQRAQHIDPDYAEAYNNLGNTYAYKGMFEEAIREYQRALHIDPNYANAYNNLGNVYINKGMFEEAIREYQQALHINPNYADAYNNLGNTYAYKGMFEEAIREYQRALDIDPNYGRTHLNLGIAYASKGMDDEAIGEYQRALKLDPDYAEAHMNLGIAYANKRMFNEAIREYQKVLILEPDSAGAHMNLGVAYANTGMFEEAIREYQRALRIKPDFTEALYNLGNAYSYKGKYDEAIRAYQNAVQINPYFAEAHYKLGAIYYHRKQYNLSMRHFKLIEKLDYPIPLEFREML